MYSKSRIDKMEVELTPNRFIGGAQPCYIIAEIGQNHQGEMSIAMELIKTAKQSNCDCVKFQKSYATSKFTQSALARPYVSQHSFGSTYGEHKAALELTDEQFHFLQRYSQNEGITFSASAMDLKSVDFLASINVPFIKIGSGDTNNFPLIRHVASKNKPVIYSTGMHDIGIIQSGYELLLSNKPLVILHCVSSYPTPIEEINLHVLKTYETLFTRAIIGYSGHEEGTVPTLASVALGAKVVERHITLSKTMKGNDHRCSLEPAELAVMVEQIRQVERSLGSATKKRQQSEEACFMKLGKSIVARKQIEKGHIIEKSDMDVKVAEPNGLEAHNFDLLVGKRAKQCIPFDFPIQADDIY